MATTLETILNDILTTVYGKDVRQAIHDGIQQCYADATGNPESVAKLANDLASYSQRLEETRTLIQQLNDSLVNQETTLWSDGVGSTAKNESFALGDSVSNYDYIDIYVNFYGLGEIRRINVSKANAEFYRLLRFHNFPDNAGDDTGQGINNTAGYNAMELYLTFKGKTMTITNSTYFTWNGTVDSGGKGSINLDDDANRRVVKIVGIKRFKGSSSAGMNAQTKTVKPTLLSQSIVPDSNYNCLSQVTVEAIPVNKTSNTTGTTVTIG